MNWHRTRGMILIAALCCVSTANAQTINVTGTVIDSATSQPIAGALVRIVEYPATTATSASNGTFVLTNISTRPIIAAGRNGIARVKLLGNRLTVLAPESSGRIVVEVYNCGGARIHRAEWARGDACFSDLWRTPGLYFISVRMGADRLCFTSAGTAPDSFTDATAGFAKSTAASATYTLQVAAANYTTKQVSIPGLSCAAGTIRMVKSTVPPIGNPAGACTVPPEAAAASVAAPDHVVGAGTPASCTGDAFISAVALGGTITFNCGADPVTITLTRPAKVFNDAPKTEIVIDGGGKVTLNGGGTTRILYMNTCDQNQHWTTSHCQDQDSPHLTVQNLTFSDGDSRNESQYDGGGAIWVRGGRFKIVNCRFFNNTCDSLGPDVGGAAVRVFSQSQGLPVYVVNTTFGGADGYGNFGANGGGISSIGVSWTVINSLFSYNRAIGNGGNPATSGTPGGGSGGAIYNDGNTMTLSLCGCLIEHNSVNSFGSAIFFVTNDHTGDIKIDQSVIHNNVGGSWYPVWPGISMHADTKCVVTNSTIE